MSPEQLTEQRRHLTASWEASRDARPPPRPFRIEDHFPIPLMPFMWALPLGLLVFGLLMTAKGLR